MIDVDHFKHFNDRFGHQVGDQILRFIATRLKRVSFGLAFRYGGEEFALIMPGRRVQRMLPLLDQSLRSGGRIAPPTSPGGRTSPLVERNRLG
jgi:diguanylate cyclase (GGDEF)-like protein